MHDASNQGAANMTGWSPSAPGVSIVGGRDVIVDYGNVPSTAHGLSLDEAVSTFTLSGVEFRNASSSEITNVIHIHIAGAEDVTVEESRFRACGPRPVAVGRRPGRP
jgi:hypothetical protein